MHFDDAGGFDARAQDVLLGGHVILGAESLQIIQEASVTDHVTVMVVRNTHVHTGRSATSQHSTQHCSFKHKCTQFLCVLHDGQQSTLGSAKNS